MRAFFALELGEAARARLEDVCRQLQRWELPARWTHPYDLHVTICYLGDVEEHELGWICHSADTIAGAQVVPHLHMPGLGAFAGRRAPRVVYAAVHDPEEWCAHLHRDLAEAVSVEVEPHYLPHITLCRPRSDAPRGKRSWAELLTAYGQAAFGPCEVTALHLYRSDARPDGQRRYRSLASWPLIGAPRSS